MGPELNPVIFDLPQVSKTEDLEASAISQDRALPFHELMQTANFTDYFMPWSKIEMICI